LGNRVSPAAHPFIASARQWLTANPHAATAALNGLVGAGYWLLAELVLLAVSETGTRLTPVWPASGLAVAACWLVGPRILPGIYAASLLVLAPRAPLAHALLAGLAPVVEATVDAFLLRRLRYTVHEGRRLGPLLLGLVVTPAGAAAAALVGTGSAVLFGLQPATLFVSGWTLWWLRDWLGAFVVSSLVFAWRREPPFVWTRARVLEALALAGSLLLASQAIFGLWRLVGARDVPGAFLIFPLLIWAGLRFGARGATTLVALITAFAIVIVGLGAGPFRGLPVATTQFLLFMLLMSFSLSGQLISAIIAERDEALQRRLQLEEQLRHSQKMEAVGRLAGGIAHDFNNLLTAIIGYAEIVIGALDPKDPRRADAEEVGRAALRAADLTRQMLAFSRRQALQPKTIDLNRTLTRVQPMIRRLIGEDILLSIVPKASTSFVRVDPGQVEQVLMNLVVNARDAMPRGGRLTIETGEVVLDDAAAAENPDARPGRYVALSVTDTGVGMAAAVRARIFEPYFTTKDVGKGTGLGLSTAYGIVRQSDGHINVVSEVGMGTTFRVLLPRAEAPEARVEEESALQRLPAGTEHVLLVEDDPSVRRLAKDLLSRLGYNVTEAASGRAGMALGSDETKHFDLALCDVILGDMSGTAVAEALTALRPSIRVLFMSGYSDDAIVRTGVLDEGRPFLQKPFTPIQLARKIREVLEEDREAGAA
jgi:signal transduction histidine kinase/CheY-like chemotaxis protein